MNIDLLINTSEYLNNNDFMYSLSLINKHNFFNERRIKINKIRSSKLLYDSLDRLLNMSYVNEECKYIQEMLAYENITIYDLLLSIKRSLLKEKENISFKNSFKGKYVVSRTCRNRIYNDFNNNDYEIVNVKLCSTYRLTYSEKRYVVNNTKYAKALIY